MTKIIFATGNKDKMREIREIMQDCDVEIISMSKVIKEEERARDAKLALKQKAQKKAEALEEAGDEDPEQTSFDI